MPHEFVLGRCDKAVLVALLQLAVDAHIVFIDRNIRHILGLFTAIRLKGRIELEDMRGGREILRQAAQHFLRHLGADFAQSYEALHVRFVDGALFPCAQGLIDVSIKRCRGDAPDNIARRAAQAVDHDICEFAVPVCFGGKALAMAGCQDGDTVADMRDVPALAQS